MPDAPRASHARPLRNHSARRPDRPARPLLVVLVAMLAIISASPLGDAMAATPDPSAASPSPAGASPAASLSPPPSPPEGAVAPVDDAAWELAARLRGARDAAESLDATIDALALGGIAVYATPSDPEPVRPVTTALSPARLLGWQADALALRTSAGAVQSGAALDEAMALPRKLQKGQPTPSQLIAGYVAAADSPAAALSRAMLAGQDLHRPEELRIPELVLLLFLSDLATDGGTLASDPPMPVLASSRELAAIAGGVRTAAGGICSDAATWVDNAIHGLFNAIKLRTPRNLPGAILVGIWNWLVDQGEALVHRLIGALTSAVLGTVRFIAAGVAQLVTRVVSLVPYAVTLHTQPNQRFVLPPQAPGPRGWISVSVSHGDLPDWPDILKDCADVAGIDLPVLRPKGAKVDWKPSGEGLAWVDVVVVRSELDADGEAEWWFRGKPDGVEKGDEVEVFLTMQVTVHRPEIEEARASLGRVLLAGLPDFVADFLGELFAPYLKAAAARLDKLVSSEGTGGALIVYHTPKDPDASPTPTPTPTRTPVPTKATVDLRCEHVIPASEVARVSGHGDMHLDERDADPFGPLAVLHACHWTNVPPGATRLPADAYEYVISYGLAKNARSLARGMAPLQAEVGGDAVGGIGDAALYVFSPGDENDAPCGTLYVIKRDRYVSVSECPADGGTLARLRAGAKVILGRL